jgi:SAM-dependent methyltransferase
VRQPRRHGSRGPNLPNTGRSLEAADQPWDTVERWLDFGCGYGRVTRYLLERVPTKGVWGTDLLPEAVRFCAKEFGVHPLPDLAADEPVAGGFDLTYAISVYIHISSADANQLTKLLTGALAPGGLLVATTQGPRVGPQPRPVRAYFALGRSEFVDQFTTAGYRYIPHAHSRDSSYSMASTTRSGVEQRFARQATWPSNRCSYEPAGLDGHQDLYVYRRFTSGCK